MAKPDKLAPKGVKRPAVKPDGAAKRQKMGSATPKAAAPATPMTSKERKALLREKKAKVRPNFTLVQQATVLWEELRRHDVKPARRGELVTSILAKLKGKLAELAGSHTASRIVQACVKHGSAQQRATVLDELRPKLQELAKSPYGHFVVMKLIATAPKAQLKEFHKAFKGRIPELLRHPTAAQVVDELYGASANPARNAMAAEFYAREYRLFEGGTLNGLEDAPASLNALLAAVDGAKAASILQHLSAAVLPVVEKHLVDAALVHRVVAEFMAAAPASVVADAVASLAGEPLLHMVHTRDGAAAAAAVFAHGTPRDRKKAVRALKGHVVSMAKDEWGHLALITCLSVVDDTALLRKFVAAELQKELRELVQHPHGRRVILQLLRPDCNRYLPPDCQALAHPKPRIYSPSAAPSGHEHGPGGGPGCETPREPEDAAQEPGAEPAADTRKKKEKNDGDDGDGDDDAAPAPLQPGPLGLSKKDPELRRSEVLSGGLGAALCTLCTEEASMLLRLPTAAAVVAEVAAGGIPKAALGENADAALNKLHTALAELVAEPRLGEAGGADAGAGPAQEHILDSWHGSRTLRWLALAGQGDAGTGPSAAARAVASHMWRDGLRGRCKVWVDTHGAKVLAAIWGSLGSKEQREMERELTPLVKESSVAEWAAKFTARKKEA